MKALNTNQTDFTHSLSKDLWQWHRFFFFDITLNCQQIWWGKGEQQTPSHCGLPRENEPHLLCRRQAWGSHSYSQPQSARPATEHWMDPSKSKERQEIFITADKVKYLFEKQYLTNCFTKTLPSFPQGFQRAGAGWEVSQEVSGWWSILLPSSGNFNKCTLEICIFIGYEFTLAKPKQIWNAS